MKKSKNIKEYRTKIDRLKHYELSEAVQILKDNKFVKFDESIEVAIRLGVNPKHADQMVRGTVALPNGTGKSVTVVVFAQGDKVAEATEAGADFVGSDDLAAKIKGGWTDFDVCVATPDMMRVLGPLGKVLGPRGLMPNPKTGTVTMDLARTVKELKGGRIEFRIDKQANIAGAVGKLSFDADKIIENITAYVDAIVKAKPTTTKGAYVLGISVCSTMSPGVKLDHQQLLLKMKK
ncbi:MAG TPA: 50S ribosomal protein L1 [candidate division Zixibacteria bacterium]|nr:50S ribosomal protein L1 [candidate division Zixibacteria bacterium]